MTAQRLAFFCRNVVGRFFRGADRQESGGRIHCVIPDGTTVTVELTGDGDAVVSSRYPVAVPLTGDGAALVANAASEGISRAPVWWDGQSGSLVARQLIRGRDGITDKALRLRLSLAAADIRAVRAFLQDLSDGTDCGASHFEPDQSHICYPPPDVLLTVAEQAGFRARGSMPRGYPVVVLEGPLPERGTAGPGGVSGRAPAFTFEVGYDQSRAALSGVWTRGLLDCNRTSYLEWVQVCGLFNAGSDTGVAAAVRTADAPPCVALSAELPLGETLNHAEFRRFATDFGHSCLRLRTLVDRAMTDDPALLACIYDYTDEQAAEIADAAEHGNRSFLQRLRSQPVLNDLPGGGHPAGSG